MSAWNIPAGAVCQSCGERPATMPWSEGVMAAVHGSYEHLCEVCVLRRQIQHAEEAAAMLPPKRVRLDELLQAETNPETKPINRA